MVLGNGDDLEPGPQEATKRDWLYQGRHSGPKARVQALPESPFQARQAILSAEPETSPTAHSQDSGPT